MPLVTIADIGGPDFEAMLARARKVSAMYDEYTANDEGNTATREPGIHASEISGCKRKVVYSLLNYPRRGKIGKNWRQRFQVGHALHAMIQRDFHAIAANSNGLVAFEDETKIAPQFQPLADKWFIYSSCDGVITLFDKPGGPPVLRVGLEIKTEAPDGYDKLKEPKPTHIEQAHIYMACLDIPLFWFLYMNKGNQNNTGSDGPFLIRWNPLVWAGLEARFQEFHDYSHRGELPDREESMVCQFCAFAHTCQPPSLIRPQRLTQRIWNPKR